MADDEPHEPTMEDLAEAIRGLEVGQFLLSMVSTLASLAFGKLEQGELGQAKAAIDAIAALLPVMKGQVDEALVRDLEQALANLQVAYVEATSAAGD